MGHIRSPCHQQDAGLRGHGGRTAGPPPAATALRAQTRGRTMSVHEIRATLSHARRPRGPREPSRSPTLQRAQTGTPRLPRARQPSPRLGGPSRPEPNTPHARVTAELPGSSAFVLARERCRADPTSVSGHSADRGRPRGERGRCGGARAVGVPGAGRGVASRPATSQQRFASSSLFLKRIREHRDVGFPTKGPKKIVA